ncbi:hypothetical protein [Rhodococcus sp. 24CO]|uniref:hypothetical protein n=1 Tax=Rhodococcus sp. 24CO TaxID=3117460 RepID=UPI003D34FBF0
MEEFEYRAPGVGRAGWRVVDADRVKDYLLRDALDQGFYDDLLGQVFGRRGPVDAA